MKTVKRGAEEIEEIAGDSGEEEVLEDVTFGDKLQSWMERCSIEDVEATVYVYKMVSGNTKSLCGKFVGMEIPDEHVIGMQYGSGDYRIVARLPSTGDGQKMRQTSFSFKVAACYDDMRRQAAMEGRLPVLGGSRVPPAAPAPVGGGMDAMGAFREGMQFVAEMFGKIQQPVQHNPVMPEMGAMMMQQYAAMGKILQNNLLETDNFLHTALKKRNVEAVQPVQEEDDGDGEPEGNPLMKLLPEVLKLLPMLLQNKQAAPLITEAVQQSANMVPAMVQQVAARKAQKKKRSPVASSIPPEERGEA